MEELQRLYEDYLDLVAQLQRDRKPFEGAFGLGGGPAAHPCHQQFAKDVEQVMARVPEEQRLQAIEYIFRQALDHKGDPLVYWMFMAVHGATLLYLKSLTSQQARDLQWWYEKAYPRPERMPCQQRVLSTLKKMR